MPSIKGYRRLALGGVVLAVTTGLALAGAVKSPEVANIFIAIMAGFAGPDAVEKAVGRIADRWKDKVGDDGA